MQAIPLDTFFAYHANSGGKLLTIWIGHNSFDVKKSELKKIQSSFTLQSNSKAYRVVSYKKEFTVCSDE